MALGLALCSCNKPLNVLVGTYGENWYYAKFDQKASRLKIADNVPATDPSYLYLGQDALYAVSEHDGHDGIYSFLNGEELSYLDDIGASPCYLTGLGDTPFIATADYNGGSVSVFRSDRGKLTERVQHVSFESHSHIHQLKFIPGTDWLLASDLGDDCVHVFKLEGDSKTPLNYAEDLREGFPAGCGPRHMEFNAAAQMLYIICELSDQLLVFHYSLDGDTPSFELVQILQANEAPAHGSADIHMRPDGKFLYTSHRLVNDGVAAFEVNEDGTLVKAGYYNTGKHPRNFLITPDGGHMLVACRDDVEVQVYSIDAATGALTYHSATGFGQDKPVCVILAE